jgi:hypothetical protein
MRRIRRGRILTSKGLNRLKQALERKFPPSDFPRLYDRSIGDYNFTQMENELKIRYEERSLTHDTLVKIFSERKVDLKSLEHLFRAFGEVLEEGDWSFPQEDGSPSVQPQENSESPPKRSELPVHNLPARTEFIGREEELSQLLNSLAPESRISIISIDGIGGVGKTSLAVEAAYLCCEARNTEILAYDAIVFTTFRNLFLSPKGIFSSNNVLSTLRDIFTSIANTLDDGSILRATTLSEQPRLVYRCLGKQKTLLIIDDLNSCSEDEQKEIMSFLNGIPSSTKAIITTRERNAGIGCSHSARLISLGHLPEDEGIRLIEQQLDQKKEISLEQKKKLNQCFSGLPIALVYATRQLSNGYEVESILAHSRMQADIAQYCFNHVMKSFRKEHSLALLKAIAIFDAPPVHQAVTYVAGLEEQSEEKIADAIAELRRLALIPTKREPRPEREPRYEMVSITRDFALEECRDTKETLNGRKTEWYLRLTKENGGPDWGDWKGKYDQIKDEWGNIRSVLGLCAGSNQYDKFKEIWNQVNHFADLYGYWVDRMTYLDWLIKEALEKRDWQTYTLSLARKSWTLTMMGREENLIEARELIDEAYRYRENADLLLQDYLAHNTAVLLTRQRLYPEARRILMNKENLVAQISVAQISAAGIEQDSSLMERHLVRLRLNTQRDLAKIDFEENQILEAKQGYQDILNKAMEINWKRLACYSLNKLADIAIQENKCEEAEAHLKKGITIAKDNSNKRRLAYYYKSFANLARKRSNSEEANREASTAIELFKQIGMEKEAEELRSSFPLASQS